jgi:hypothetical protein
MFQKWAGPNHYTIEAGASARMIFTAEPENIKAILATQFKEYGKGEQFRKDWHAFLGDGILTRTVSYGITHVSLSDYSLSKIALAILKSSKSIFRSSFL